MAACNGNLLLFKESLTSGKYIEAVFRVGHAFVAHAEGVKRRGTEVA